MAAKLDPLTPSSSAKLYALVVKIFCSRTTERPKVSRNLSWPDVFWIEYVPGDRFRVYPLAPMTARGCRGGFKHNRRKCARERQN